MVYVFIKKNIYFLYLQVCVRIYLNVQLHKLYLCNPTVTKLLKFNVLICAQSLLKAHFVNLKYLKSITTTTFNT